MVRFLLRALLCGCVYLWLAGQLSPDELIAAVLAGLVASAGSERFLSAAHRSFARAPGTFAASWRGIRDVPLGCIRCAGLLIRALAARRTGEVGSHAFHYGHPGDPEDSLRRGLAPMVASLAPDALVISVERGRDVVLLHTLVRHGRRSDQRWIV